jgi:hypothetical protein
LRGIAACGYGPHEANEAVLNDEHALRRFIDENVELCFGAFDADGPCQCCG